MRVQTRTCLTSLDGNTMYPEWSICSYLGTSLITPSSVSDSDSTPKASTQSSGETLPVNHEDNSSLRKRTTSESSEPREYIISAQPKIVQSNSFDSTSDEVEFLGNGFDNHESKTERSNSFENETPVTPTSSRSQWKQFFPSRTEFYHVTSSVCCSSHESRVQDRKQLLYDNQELYDLVEQCFEKKITSSYIVGILQSRKRQDHQARNYIKKIHVVGSVRGQAQENLASTSVRS